MNVSADASSGIACSPDNLRQEIRLVTIAALEGTGIFPGAAEPGLKALKLELKFPPGGVLIKAADFVHGL